MSLHRHPRQPKARALYQASPRINWDSFNHWEFCKFHPLSTTWQSEGNVSDPRSHFSSPIIPQWRNLSGLRTLGWSAGKTVVTRNRTCGAKRSKKKWRECHTYGREIQHKQNLIISAFLKKQFFWKPSEWMQSSKQSVNWWIVRLVRIQRWLQKTHFYQRTT